MGTALREILATFGVEVDTGPLDKADKHLEHSKEKAGELKSKFKELAVGLVEAFALYESFEFVKGQIEIGSHLSHTAEKLGLTTEELQKFQYAANMSDVDMESAAHTLGKFNKAIGEAASASATGAENFTSIGVAIKGADGKTRPVLDVLGDVSDHFQAMEDPTAKAALAMKLFGKSGQEMIPFLNKGGASLEALSKEAEKSGGILGQDFLDAAEQAEQATKKFSFTLEGAKSKIALAVLPTLTSLVDKATSIAKAFGDLASNSTLLDTGLIALALSLGAVALAIGIIDLEMGLALLVFVGAALAVGILYLAVDDLLGLFTGKDSVTGRVLDFFIGVGNRKKELDDVGNSVNALGDALGSLGVQGMDMGEIFNTFVLAPLVEGFVLLGRAIQLVADAMTYAIRLGKALSSLDAGQVANAVAQGKGSDALASLASGSGPSTHAFDALPQIKHGGYGAPDADMQARAREQKITNSYAVTVNGVPNDPKALGRAVAMSAVATANGEDYSQALQAAAGL